MTTKITAIEALPPATRTAMATALAHAGYQLSTMLRHTDSKRISGHVRGLTVTIGILDHRVGITDINLSAALGLADTLLIAISGLEVVIAEVREANKAAYSHANIENHVEAIAKVKEHLAGVYVTLNDAYRRVYDREYWQG